MKEWLDDFLCALKDVSWAAVAVFTVFAALAGIVCGVIALMDALGVL